MSDTDLRLVPPNPPGLDMQDAWYCYEYRKDNEDFVSPWFRDETDIFEYLKDTDEFLITRKYVRTSDGIRECDGLGGTKLLKPDVIDEAWLSVPYTSAEDEVA